MYLSYTVFELFDVEEYRYLETYVKDHSDSVAANLCTVCTSMKYTELVL